GEPARGRMPAPCRSTPAPRASAAWYVGQYREQARAPSSTTIHRRRGRLAPPRSHPPPEAPVPPLHLPCAAPAQNPADWHSHARVSLAPGAAGRPRLATARDTIHLLACPETRVRPGHPSTHRVAMLPPARGRAQIEPDGLRATQRWSRRARRDGTRPR